MDSFKQWLLAAAGLSQDSLHTYFGFILFFGAAALLRRPPSAWLPWIILVVFAFCKEAYDIVTDLRTPGQWSAFKSVVDFVSVIFWPTVIMFMVRHGLVFKKQ